MPTIRIRRLYYRAEYESSVDQLNELMKSLELELDPSDIELLDRASDSGGALTSSPP
jgi:hypothetical protein